MEMAIFGIKTENSEIVKQFMIETKERMNQHNFIKNPFVGNVYKINETTEELLYGIVLKPIYPHFYLIGVIWISAVAYMNMGWFAYLPGVIMLSLGIFYCFVFYYVMLLIALRKHKYKGKVKFVGARKTLEQWVMKYI